MVVIGTQHFVDSLFKGRGGEHGNISEAIKSFEMYVSNADGG